MRRTAPHFAVTPEMTPRLLIIGCGDVGLRVLKLLSGRWRVYALTSTPARAAAYAT